MTNKTKLQNILGKDEITLYEVKSIIDAVCEHDPMNTFVKLDEMIKNDVNSAIDKLKTSYGRISDCIDEYRKTLDMAFDKLEKDYDDRKEQMQCMKTKIEELAKIEFPNFYQLERFISVCNSYTAMGEEGKNLFMKIIEKASPHND